MLQVTENELKKRGIQYEKIVQEFSDDDRAIVDEATDALLILFISKGKIVGGSMVSKNAGDLYQELVLAMSAKLNVGSIFNKTYAYSTAGRINGSTILKYKSAGFTGFKKKLSKSVLKFMYR